MGSAARKQTYPYITTNPRIAAGAPVVKGTRITVRTIAGYYQMGMSVDEILNTLQHLTASQVHSALAYYFDHQTEIEQDMKDAADIEHWKERALSHAKPAAPGK